MAGITDPGSLVVLGLVGWCYALGLRRWRAARRRGVVGTPTVVCFFAGLAVAAAATASPLDAAAQTSLAAHMTQHVALLAVAGPLLALGAPLPTLLWALPERSRRRALLATRRLRHHHDRHFVAWVSVSLVLEGVVMWAWHAPVAYQAALRNPALHAAEHGSFLLASAGAWWTIAAGRASRRGAAAVAALFGSVPGMALGAAMVLAPNPWYPAYATGTAATALRDQQVAGVVMWAFGGMATVVIGAIMFRRWLVSGDPGPEPVVPAWPGDRWTAPARAREVRS